MLFRTATILTFLLILTAGTARAGSGGPSGVGVGGRWTQRDSTASFYTPRHRRITFQFDTRYSLVSSQRATINGFKLGVEWRSRFRTGVGFYTLNPTTQVNVKPGPDWPDGTTAEARFRYVALYGEYVIRGNPRWEISAPVQLGFGRYWVQYTGPDGLRNSSVSQRLFLLEPTIAGQVRIFRWIGLGAGTGWRQVLSDGMPADQSISGPIFYSRVKLYLGDMFKVIRARQPFFTQQGLRRRDWRREAVLDDEMAD